jgi:hypothetical protein
VSPTLLDPHFPASPDFFLVSRYASAIANPQSRYSLVFVGALAFLDHITYIADFSSSSGGESIFLETTHSLAAPNQDDIPYLK